MNDLQRGVIAIVYSALTGENVSLPKDFNLSDGVTIAKKHKIEAIFYYGALNCGFGQDEPFMQELFLLVCRNLALSEQQIYSVNVILSAFDQQKIDYLPLKGALIKSIYPKPEMRSMGDADILIKTEQYGEIKPIMQRLGYTEVVESDHEYIWNKQNVHIELHKRLIPSYNKDYYAYFGDGWRLAKEKNGTRYSMTDEDQMIYLFTHFAKHYRDAGIGIKHIVDLWVYRKNNPNLDESYIKRELIALQLYNFYVNIVNTLSVWFEGREPDEKTDFITSVIFDSGVYGTSKAHILSEAVKKSKSAQSAKSIKRNKFINNTFLPYENMSLKYPFLKKAPFLLPIMWIYRIIFAIIFRSNRVKAEARALGQMSAKNINSYQDSLTFVGLDFNFKE